MAPLKAFNGVSELGANDSPVRARARSERASVSAPANRRERVLLYCYWKYSRLRHEFSFNIRSNTIVTLITPNSEVAFLEIINSLYRTANDVEIILSVKVHVVGVSNHAGELSEFGLFIVVVSMKLFSRSRRFLTNYQTQIVSDRNELVASSSQVTLEQSAPDRFPSFRTVREQTPDSLFEQSVRLLLGWSQSSSRICFQNCV